MPTLKIDSEKLRLQSERRTADLHQLAQLTQDLDVHVKALTEAAEYFRAVLHCCIGLDAVGRDVVPHFALLRVAAEKAHFALTPLTKSNPGDEGALTAPLKELQA